METAQGAVDAAVAGKAAVQSTIDFELPAEKASAEAALAEAEVALAKTLVVAGTDKGVPGFSLHRELELYVEGGMTPLQAIQTATVMPARAMKLDGELGTLEVGKRADFVVLDANPLERIGAIRDARWVAHDGMLYDCDVLWRAAGYGAR